MASTCFEQLSVHPQEDLHMQFYGISFVHPYKQYAYMNAWNNTIKPHVQEFLKVNTWLFATCRRQCNWIQSLMEKVCILLVHVTYIHLSFVLCFMSSCLCDIRFLWSTNSSLKLYFSCTTFSFSAYGTTGLSFLFIYLQ